MVVGSLDSCPHCRALVQSSICSICGKSAFEEVAAPEAPPEPEKWWKSFENREPQKVAAAIVVFALIGAIAAYALTRPETEETANALPAPASTTTNPALLDEETRAPSIENGALPVNDVVTPGAPREVGEGLSPWETPPAIDFVTGQLLDEKLDYTDDIARVNEIFEAFPPAFGLEPLDPPVLLTFGGSVDADQVQETQPFGVRTIHRPDGLLVGELWLIASSGSDVGDDYLAAARDRWNIDAAIEQFSPEVGVRLWLLGGNDDDQLWATDLDATSMVIIQAPVSVDPATLTDALRAWRQRLR